LRQPFGGHLGAGQADDQIDAAEIEALQFGNADLFAMEFERSAQCLATAEQREFRDGKLAFLERAHHRFASETRGSQQGNTDGSGSRGRSHGNSFSEQQDTVALARHRFKGPDGTCGRSSAPFNAVAG
jgi:hypothetical protein